MQPEPSSVQPEPIGAIWASRKIPEEGWVNGVFILMPDFVYALQRDVQSALSNSVLLPGEDPEVSPNPAASINTLTKSFKWSPSTLSLLSRTVEASAPINPP